MMSDWVLAVSVTQCELAPSCDITFMNQAADLRTKKTCRCMTAVRNKHLRHQTTADLRVPMILNLSFDLTTSLCQVSHTILRYFYAPVYYTTFIYFVLNLPFAVYIIV